MQCPALRENLVAQDIRVCHFTSKYILTHAEIAMSQSSAGDRTPRKPALQTATPAETASFVLDMCRSMADMAHAKEFEFLAYLLNMAALEAAEIQIRLGTAIPPPPGRPSAQGGAS